MLIRFDYQHFADAGSLVNTSQNYVNAYTGVATAFDNPGPNSLSSTMKEFYDTELLENARMQMVYAQFAKKQPLPANHGMTVEWRKWNTFAKAGKLVEGVIPQGQKFGQTSLKDVIDQYGTYTTISDRLELRGYDDTILGATEEMGASAAETSEILIRNDLLAGTNVLYCDNVNPASSYAYVSTPASQFEMRNVSTAVSLLTPTMVNKAYTKLVKGKAVPINGKFVAVIHPSVAYDLRENPNWIDVHKYAATTEIFNGEIGELHNVRFIMSNYAPVLVGPDVSTTHRWGTFDSWSTPSGEGTPLTDTGDAGVTTGYCITITETPSAELVGHYIFAIDATNATTEASAHCNGWLMVEGVDASAKKVYVDAAPDTAFAEGDWIVPGDGGKEIKEGSQNAAYATYFFGKEAFGIIDPAEGGLEMIVHDKKEIGGPLDQFSTIGYKFETNGAKILYEERILRVMSCSSASGTDAAN